MDFKTVRAMFEEKEHLLKQPKAKPVVPEKPKAVPPPQSPTYLPAGARPSLLTSMNQALEANAVNAPRVVFREEKKEVKQPLIQANAKGKDKTNGKVKETKSKIGKERKKQEEKQENSSDMKDKKFPSFLTKKEGTAELVPAPPPPKAQKKKGFPVFKKSTKRDSATLLDTPSLEVSAPLQLLPVASDADNMPEESIYSIPKSNLIKQNSSADPEPPDFSPLPVSCPDVPALRAPTPQIETPSETENPALPVFSTISQTEMILSPPSVGPSPPADTASTPPNTDAPSRPSFAPPAPPNNALPLHEVQLPVATSSPANIMAPSLSATAIFDPLPSPAPAPPNTAPLTHPHRVSPSPLLSASPVSSLQASPIPPTKLALPKATAVASSPPPSPPELQAMAEFDQEDVTLAVAAGESALSPEPDSTLSKIERPVSALSFLERAEDMGPGSKTSPGDLRILNALEKARKKAAR